VNNNDGSAVLPQLSLKDIKLTFGGVRALDGVSFDVMAGEIMAIIGPNGAGKTSVINSISGYYHPQAGAIFFEGKKISGLPTHSITRMGISRTFQGITIFDGMTVVDNLMVGRHVHLKHGLLAGGAYYGKARNEEIKNRKVVEEIIDFLEMEPIRKQIAGTLPYGLRKRVDLGRALAMEPRLLLLDEPTAGMNMEEKEDMARFILDIHEEKGTTIVLVEHDMEVVMDIVDKVTVLDFGRKIAEGTTEEIQKDDRVVKAYLGVADN